MVECIGNFKKTALAAGLSILLAAVTNVGAARAQQMVKGVPYSATIVYTRTTPERTWSSKVARASNGSTYSQLAYVGPDPQRLALVYIYDEPGRRYITLDPNSKTYTVRLADVPPLHDGQTDDAQVRDRIEVLRALPPKHFADEGREGDITPLGCRTVDGRVECGFRRTFTKLPANFKMAQKVWDTWEVPALYLDAETIGYDDAGNAANVTKYTDIQAVEPDAHLFEIPQDYTAATAHPIR